MTSAALLYTHYKALVLGVRATAARKLALVNGTIGFGWWMLGAAWYDEAAGLGCDLVGQQVMRVNLIIPAGNIAVATCAVAMAGYCAGFHKLVRGQLQPPAAAAVSPERLARVFVPGVPGDEDGDDACWIPMPPPGPPCPPPTLPAPPRVTRLGLSQLQ